MATLYMDRIAYRNGIEKQENKVIELHGFCDCNKCKYRRLNMKNGLRNRITVTVENENRLNEAVKFIKNWKCNKDTYTADVEYVNF